MQLRKLIFIYYRYKQEGDHVMYKPLILHSGKNLESSREIHAPGVVVESTCCMNQESNGFPTFIHRGKCF